MKDFIFLSNHMQERALEKVKTRAKAQHVAENLYREILAMENSKARVQENMKKFFEHELDEVKVRYGQMEAEYQKLQLLQGMPWLEAKMNFNKCADYILNKLQKMEYFFPGKKQAVKRSLRKHSQAEK